MKRQGSRCKGDGRGARHARRLCLRAFRARAGARAWTQRGWQRHRMLWWRAHWAMERTRRLHAELAWCGRMLACYAGPDARMRVALPPARAPVCRVRVALPAHEPARRAGCGAEGVWWGGAGARDGRRHAAGDKWLSWRDKWLSWLQKWLSWLQTADSCLSCVHAPACPVGVCVSLRGPRRLDGGVLSGADGRRVVCVLCAVAMYTR